MAVLNFNASTVAPSTAFEPLQPGWYNVKIVESETKPVNPPKTGSYLALTLEVLDGPAMGRKLFLNLNLENENPVAVKIAYEQLSAICYVTGRIQCGDSQELHGIPFQAKISIRAASGQYEASNDVKGFRDIHGNEPKDIASGNATGATAAPGAPPVPDAPQAPTPLPAPSAPLAPPAAPPPHDPFAAAVADGWAVHPTSPGWYFKGTDVKADADVAALYPAPAAPLAPPVPSAPSAPAGSAVPPWAKAGA